MPEIVNISVPEGGAAMGEAVNFLKARENFEK
jgi:hypothetical protein